MVGALASLGTTFINQRLQACRERLTKDLANREELYGGFIEEIIPLFVDSINCTTIDPSKLLNLYSMVARIRLISSDERIAWRRKSGGRPDKILPATCPRHERDHLSR